MRNGDAGVPLCATVVTAVSLFSCGICGAINGCGTRGAKCKCGYLWRVIHWWRRMCGQSTQYEFERRKYAQDLIAFDKKFSAMFSGKFDGSSTSGLSHEDFLAYVTPAGLPHPHLFPFGAN
jgi:hypothetical protein